MLSSSGYAIVVAISLSEQFSSDSNLERNLQFNSKSRDISKMGQKGNIFNLKLSTTMRSVEIFGQMEDCVLYF
jgi:hypothetical protein